MLKRNQTKTSWTKTISLAALVSVLAAPLAWPTGPGYGGIITAACNALCEQGISPTKLIVTFGGGDAFQGGGDGGPCEFGPITPGGRDAMLANRISFEIQASTSSSAAALDGCLGMAGIEGSGDATMIKSGSGSYSLSGSNFLATSTISSLCNSTFNVKFGSLTGMQHGWVGFQSAGDVCLLEFTNGQVPLVFNSSLIQSGEETEIVFFDGQGQAKQSLKVSTPDGVNVLLKVTKL